MLSRTRPLFNSAKADEIDASRDGIWITSKAIKKINSGTLMSAPPSGARRMSAPRSGARILARGTRFLRTPGKNTPVILAPRTGCEEFLDTPSGCGLGFAYIPGVRKKRVRLADVRAPLQRAQEVNIRHASAVRHSMASG